MIKTISLIGILSLLITSNSHANDSDRITQLENEIQELKTRIVKIESLIIDPKVSQKIVTSGESKESIKSWRKLTTDMTQDDVVKILGEPQRIEGGSIAFWYYKSGGSVTFHNDKLKSWTEPRE
jgi:hypothetical protein